MRLTDIQGGVQSGDTAHRDDHPLAGGHATCRAVRAPRPRCFLARGLVALALSGLALSGLVLVPGAARAEAPLETPGADSITFNRSEGRIGAAVLNDSGTDRTTVVADNSYFGIVPGMTVYNSADPNQRSVAYRAGYSQDWLDADTAKSGDYWSYVTRGVAWDYHLAAYYRYPYYGEYTPNAISTSTTSALGYKPNNPGTVPLNSTFLIGAVRHNNFPIYSQIHWVHSSFDIRIGDLEESFPFDQQETDNDTDTTAVRRKGGPYEWVSRASAPRTCPSTAPYYALARSDHNWHCFKKVGEGKGRYDIYTDQPQYYPGSAGKPDQTPDSDDILTITKTTSDQTITVNGIPYRLVLYGFVPNADGNCPATPPAGSTPVSSFTTKESQASFGCLYGSFSQERYVRVAKAVTEDSEQVGDAIPPFTFTTMGLGDWSAPTGTPLTTSVTADGFVDWKSFEDANLTPTAYGKAGAATSGYKAFMPGFSQFIIAETGPRIAGRFPLQYGAQGRFGPWKTSDDPNSAQWSLVDVTCLNGVGERVNVTRDAETGGVDFSQVAPASSPAALPITCTFTNREQTPKLRIQKDLESVEGATTDDITVTYRITATNDGTLAGTTGRLTDTPNFAPGLSVRSAAVATSLDALDATTEQGAASSYVLTEGSTIEPGASSTWYIRMKVTRDTSASGYSEALLECASSNERLTPGRGLYNAVTGAYDHDGEANNEACAPARPRPIRIEKAGTQPVGTPNDDGTYPLDGAAFAIYDNEALVGDPVSVLDGGSRFVTAPLETGKTYWLVETRAPVGHALLPRPVAFHIEAGTDVDATTVIKTDFDADEGFSSVRVLPASGSLPGADRTPGIRVVDTQVGVLPKAGSIGIYPQLAGGAAMLGLAGACAWLRRREQTQVS
ncbi:MAG: SpaA isopeptide-forming pilin-related protein [Actinomyces sp.]|nr:SpaA isopeptide-forming pilin-related protein [Actinomyces sp.]